MAVYKDPATNTWRYRTVVRLRDGSKERISGTPAINTRAAALEAERAHIERTLNPPPPKPVEREKVPFDEFALYWLNTYPAAEGNTESTLMVRKSHIQMHLIPFFKDIDLEKIDAIKVAEFISHVTRTFTSSGIRGGVSKGYASPTRKVMGPNTINSIALSLRIILRSAVEWGKKSAVPKFPKRRKVELKVIFYDFEEKQKLLSVDAPFVEKAMVLVALQTGIRQSEQIGLRCGDVDSAKKVLNVRQQIHKGRTGTTKGKKSRQVPLSDKTLEVLKEVIGDRPRDAPIFTQDGNVYTARMMQCLLDRLAKKAGIRKLSWHKLRHTFASHLTMKGIALPRLQEWLGHTDIKTTMIYAHLLPNRDNDFITKLEER